MSLLERVQGPVLAQLLAKVNWLECTLLFNIAFSLEASQFLTAAESLGITTSAQQSYVSPITSTVFTVDLTSQLETLKATGCHVIVLMVHNVDIVRAHAHAGMH